MSTEYQASPQAISQLRETFQFLKHEREDVRKMAVHGIAEHSKENRDLWCFLSSKEEGGKAIDTLLQYLHAGSANILGDILTILINISAEGSCAEMLVQHKVVRKAMRLLDGMEKSALPDSFVRSIEEMTLMLLSNLTASHVSAIDDLLQKEDEDMRGFYLGKLQRYYAFFSPKVARGTAAATEGRERGRERTEAMDEGERKQHAVEMEQTEEEERPQRDLRKWILQILLNVTRTYDGQELLLSDEDWRITLDACLKSVNTIHRLLAAQCFRNCACSQKPQFPMILKCEALLTAVQRLATRDERVPEVQLCLAEFIASMLESEEGMARLEGVNAKRLLTKSVWKSRSVLDYAADANGGDGSGPSGPVEVLDDDGNSVRHTMTTAASGTNDVDGDAPSAAAATGGSGEGVVGLLPTALAAPPLTADVCETLEKHVLPYLDDIVDAYLAPGSDEVD